MNNTKYTKLNRSAQRTLARLGFVRVNGIGIESDPTAMPRNATYREPSSEELTTMTRYGYVPWFWWQIHCPHSKLWTQPCGMCSLTKSERNERMVQFVRFAQQMCVCAKC